MNIISVQFQSKLNPEEFAGREYTYYINGTVEVGDIILVPTKNGTGTAIVYRTDMKESDITEDIKPFIKTIDEIIYPAEEDKLTF